jgi:integrase
MINRSNYSRAISFLERLREVYSLSPKSVKRYWFYLRHVLLWAEETPLASAEAIKPAFASYLKGIRCERSSLPLEPATTKKIFQVSCRFFQWLKSSHPKEFRGLSASWIQALCPPAGSSEPGDHVFVTVEEAVMLATTAILDEGVVGLRDRAAVAMLFLSGMRASAFASLPIGAVDLASRTIQQLPSLGVRTKNSKAAITFLLEIPELLSVVKEWDDLVRRQLPPTAMWYTSLLSRWGVHSLSANPAGDNRNISLTKRLRRLYLAAGMQPKSPHKFRHGHAVYGLQHARSMADYKAVSMNLMHNDIRVTDAIYAVLSKEEVRSRIATLSSPRQGGGEGDGDFGSLVKGLPPEKLSELLAAIARQIVR